MTLFILFQTDVWKSKASRVFFGVFSFFSMGRMSLLRIDMTSSSLELDFFNEEASLSV